MATEWRTAATCAAVRSCLSGGLLSAEQVVHAHREGLDVRIVDRKGHAVQRSDITVAEADELVFGLGAPVGRKGPFDTRARHPAAPRAGAVDRGAGADRSGDARGAGVKADPAAAALAVEQPVIGDIAEAPRGRGRPGRVGRAVEGDAVDHDAVDGPVIAGNAIAGGLDADQPVRIELPVVADLAAADEARVRVRRPGEAG